MKKVNENGEKQSSSSINYLEKEQKSLTFYEEHKLFCPREHPQLFDK